MVLKSSAEKNEEVIYHVLWVLSHRKDRKVRGMFSLADKNIIRSDF